MPNSTALTRQEWKDAELRQAEQLGKLDAIASDIRDLHDALQAGFERLRLDDILGTADSNLSGGSEEEGSHLPTGMVFLEVVDADTFLRRLTESLKRSDHDSANLPIGDVNLGAVNGQDGDNSSPSVDGGSSPTVGDGQVAGVETAAPATDADLDAPFIDARYDRPMNCIILSCDGSDFAALDRDSGFSAIDRIGKALEMQAKLGGAA